MLITYLTEDPAADALRKARTDKQTDLDIMKAALSPAAALLIGGDPGCDVVPFRKREQTPSAPQPPRQPAIPMRPAASDDLRKIMSDSKLAGTSLSKADLHTLRLNDGKAFSEYLSRKIAERQAQAWFKDQQLQKARRA